ncbi:hypothetical protein ABN028_01350 [Actinopolymorpha sp. B17G11]|uniref:hypothetical protein n=1 Tax=Actinopolymorpha sp. B17G11 TaxID=3160861 RepID=UPI0032E526F4
MRFTSVRTDEHLRAFPPAQSRNTPGTPTTDKSGAGFMGAPEQSRVRVPAMWTGSFDADWADAGKRALILEFLRTTEEEPTIIGSGSHFLGIAHR